MRARLLGVVTAAGLLTAGCSWTHGLYNVSLPGGADLGSNPITVTVDVNDALDLVPQSGVKVNDVAVGKVTKITLASSRKSAEVQVELRSDVHLPANAVASIQQTSLLGEKYVAIGPPLTGPSVGTLEDHAVIPLSRTTDGVEAEQVLGALALLLNGGGIGQLHDIAQSLNTFAHGHEPEIRGFLTNVTTVVTQLNSHRTAITSALDALATLSTTLKGQNATLTRVLSGISPGIQELANQRTQLVGMLDALNNLSTVTVATLNASETDMISDFKSLDPILAQLAAAGSNLPKSLQVLLTYPFTDAAVAGIKGDYLNTYVTTDLNTPGGAVIGSGLKHSSSTLADHQLGPAALLPSTSSAAPGFGPSLTLAPGGGR